MQIQAATSTEKASEEANALARITFHGTRDIRRAMTAARTTMGNQETDDPRWNPSCRLIAHPGAVEVEILATDGQRALLAVVAAERGGSDEPLDVPLKTAAVRAIAASKATFLTIETDGRTSRVFDDNGADERLEATSALQAKTIRRPLERVQTGAMARKIPRTAALHAMRAMPKQSQRICRVSISRHGVQVWATNADLVGPNYEADAKLATRAERCDEEIVFGVDRSMLTAALRTMTSRMVTLHVESKDMPIVLTGEEARETVAISTKRL